eukprot:2895381-Amphidinium_carterae.3
METPLGLPYITNLVSSKNAQGKLDIHYMSYMSVHRRPDLETDQSPKSAAKHAAFNWLSVQHVDARLMAVMPDHVCSRGYTK